jgi:hypothetical protein
MDKDMLSKALSHTLKEIGIPNMVASIELDFGEIQKAHDSIHEFIYLAPLCLPKDKSWHEKSAFLTYHYVTLDMAHRSLLDALAGYYNSANILLRSTLELLIRGAFWECLAHKDFREKIEKSETKKGKKTLKGWINELIKQRPDIEDELEGTSAAIFDKTAIIFEDSKFEKEFIHHPNFREIIEQIADWNIFDPIQDPMELVYNKIYGELSKNVHVIPDETDIGRRILSQRDLFETDVNPDELSKFVKVLHEVVDIGIVIELNVLSDWINQDREVKTKLRERLAVIEDLGLKFSSEKLKRLMEYE